MKRPRFSRNCLASSRGAYVRHSHFLYIQEQLAKRGIDEVSTTTSVTVTRYYVKCFGKLKRITEKEAMMLKSELVIVL